MKKTLLVAAIIAVASFIVYRMLGGGGEVKFNVVTKDLTIYGTPYLGKSKDLALKSLFESTRQLAIEKNSALVVIDYRYDAEDSVKQFLGVISSDSIGPFSVEFKEVKFLEADLGSNNFVMPLPDEVRSQAGEFARKSELLLEDFSLELYQKENLTILFPAKAN